VSLQSAIPAQFAQIYRDGADHDPSLLLASPKGTRLLESSDYSWARDVAVAESSLGQFVRVWSSGRWDGYTHSWSDILYSLVDACGYTIRHVSALTDNSSTTLDAFDNEPVVAAAPDGSIGLVWQRYLRDTSTGTNRYLFNIYFAALDKAGNVTVPPMSLTNNSEWYQYNPWTYDVPRYYDPRIAATEDNRFVVAWQQVHQDQESAGWVDDIWYAVRSTGGSLVRPPTKLTSDTPGDSDYREPNLTALTSNRVLLTWMSRSLYNDDVYYVVLGSSGAIVKSATDLSVDESAVDWQNYDAVQLSGGRIAVFWEAWGCFPGEWVPRIRYAILDSSYSRVVAPTCLAAHPANPGGTGYPSATADFEGHAILTWMENEYPSGSLYYALIDSSGDVATAPMIFRTGKSSSPYIVANYEGYGNTTYSEDFASACKTYVPLTLRDYVRVFPGPWEREPNNSYLEANGSIFSGQDYYGYPNDEKDYFSFYMREAGDIDVELTNHTGDAVQLQLFYQSTSNRVAYDTSAPYHIQTSGAPGWYYVYIYAGGGYTQATPYTLRVTYP